MKLPKFLFMLIAILFCVSTSIRAATNSKKSSKVEKVFVIIEKYDSVNAVKFEAKEKILFINVWDPVIFVQQKKEYYNKIKNFPVKPFRNLAYRNPRDSL